MRQDHHWETAAACAGADPSLFDPVLGNRDPAHVGHVQEALTYCAVCPVLEQCRDSRSSFRSEPQLGTYGGEYVTREEANRRMINSRAAYKHGGRVQLIATITRLREQGIYYRDIGKRLGISYKTVYDLHMEGAA